MAVWVVTVLLIGSPLLGHARWLARWHVGRCFFAEQGTGDGHTLSTADCGGHVAAATLAVLAHRVQLQYLVQRRKEPERSRRRLARMLASTTPGLPYQRPERITDDVSGFAGELPLAGHVAFEQRPQAAALLVRVVMKTVLAPVIRTAARIPGPYAARHVVGARPRGRGDTGRTEHDLRVLVKSGHCQAPLLAAGPGRAAR